MLNAISNIKRLISIFCSCTIMLAPSLSHSYIGTIFHLYNPTINRHLLLFGDCHEGENCGNQQKHIIQAAQTLAGLHKITILDEDSLILVPTTDHGRKTYNQSIQGTPWQAVIEDLLRDPHSFDPNKNYYNQDQTILKDPETPIADMTRTCHKKLIPVINVECRQAMQASQSGLPITGQTACTVIRNLVNEINNYHDSEQLDIYYKDIVRFNNDVFALPYVNEIFNQPCTVYEAIKTKGHQYRTLVENQVRSLDRQHIAKNYMIDSGKTIRFDDQSFHTKNSEFSDEDVYRAFECTIFADLVDARILHYQHNLQNVGTVFICAGLAHIYNILPVLVQEGYQIFPYYGQPYMTFLGNRKQYKPVDTERYLDRYCTKQFLRSPSPIQYPCKRSLLARAIAINREAAIAALIDVQDSHGKTELMRAAETNNKNYVIQLINAGARTCIQDHKGNTALAHAIANRLFDCARLLTRAMPPHEIDIANHQGETPLMIAAFCSDRYTIHDLINNGASANIVDTRGQSAIHRATLPPCKTEVIRALAMHGANVNLQDHDGYTPLIRAAIYDDADAIKALHRAGASLALTSNQRINALFYAVTNNKMKATKALLDLGADVLKKDRSSISAVDYAIRSNNLALFKFIVDNVNTAARKLISDHVTKLFNQ